MIVVKCGSSSLEGTVGWLSSCGTPETVLNDCAALTALHTFVACGLVYCHLPS